MYFRVSQAPLRCSRIQ